MNSGYCSSPNKGADVNADFNRLTCSCPNSSLLSFHTSFNNANGSGTSVFQENFILTQHRSRRSVILGDEAEKCTVQHIAKSGNGSLPPTNAKVSADPIVNVVFGVHIKGFDSSIDIGHPGERPNHYSSGDMNDSVGELSTSTSVANIIESEPFQLLKESKNCSYNELSTPPSKDNQTGEELHFDRSLDFTLFLKAMEKCRSYDEETADDENSFSESCFSHDSIRVTIARQQRQLARCDTRYDEKNE